MRVRLKPGVDLGRSAIVERQSVPVIAQMARHGPAHHADTDKCYICHGGALTDVFNPRHIG
jgi:hypothetical protein